MVTVRRMRRTPFGVQSAGRRLSRLGLRGLEQLRQILLQRAAHVCVPCPWV